MRTALCLVLIWLSGAAIAGTGCLRPVEGGHFDTGGGGVPEFCIATATYTTFRAIRS